MVPKKNVILVKIFKMRKIVILIAFLIVSCTQNIKNEDIQLINGYWEIEKVESVKNEIKKYKINEIVDYFSINAEQNGFRKKLVIQLDGKFLANNMQESVSISNINDEFFLNYKTDFATWKEKIVKINGESLILENEQGIKYFYKRYKTGNEEAK